MGNRYGRKQKRAARAAIVALESQNAALESQKSALSAVAFADRRKLQGLLAVLNDLDRQIATLLGRESSFRVRSPEVFTRDIREFGQMRLPGDIDAPASGLYTMDALGPDAVAHFVRVVKFLALIERNSDFRGEVRKLMRLRVMDERGESCLAVSEDHWQHLRLAPLEVRDIAERMCALLVNDVNAHRNRDRRPR